MSAAWRYSKYVAAGNDFLILEGELPPSADDAQALCERRVGPGADGVIWTRPAPGGSFEMRLTNADGSPAEMSGNGIRCLAMYLAEHGHARGGAFDIETAAGSRRVWLGTGADAGSATVSMGMPAFDRAAIPMNGPADGTFLEQVLDVGGGVALLASALSMGNPHLVAFIDDDPSTIDLATFGPAIENHELFPRRTNVEFALVRDRGTIEARVWERGVGETLSCGTGACAAAVAAQEADRAGARVMVRFPGGDLWVERMADGSVALSGPVAHVEDGSVDLARSTSPRSARGTLTQ